MEHQLRVQPANKSADRYLPRELAGQARVVCACGWQGVWVFPEEAEAMLEAARIDHPIPD